MLKCINKKIMKLKCSNSKFTTGRGYNYTKAYIEEEMLKYVCEKLVAAIIIQKRISKKKC